MVAEKIPNPGYQWRNAKIADGRILVAIAARGHVIFAGLIGVAVRCF